MPGNGQIGGGSGSCLLDFTVRDDSGSRHWKEHDKKSEVGKSKVTVRFPQHPSITAVNGNEITIDLRMGNTVEIEWT